MDGWDLRRQPESDRQTTQRMRELVASGRTTPPSRLPHRTHAPAHTPSSLAPFPSRTFSSYRFYLVFHCLSSLRSAATISASGGQRRYHGEWNVTRSSQGQFSVKRRRSPLPGLARGVAVRLGRDDAQESTSEAEVLSKRSGRRGDYTVPSVRTWNNSRSSSVMPCSSFPRSVLPGVCILRLCFHQRHMHFQADIISSQGQVFAELWMKKNPPVQDRYASARSPISLPL